MKGLIVCLLLLSGLFLSCSHNNPDPVFNCDAVDTLTFEDVKPIVLTKCAVPACHDGSRPNLPILNTEQDFKYNINNCQFQVERGAMPPETGTSLTGFEKAKLLCYISEHLH
jgi:hypothetical protein